MSVAALALILKTLIVETFYKSLEHAPALAAMIIIVLAFLKFTKELLASHAKRTDEFITAVKDMHLVVVELSIRTNDLTVKNIEALVTNTQATKEVTKSFNDLSIGLAQQNQQNRRKQQQ